MPTEEPGDFMDYLAAVPISNARGMGLKTAGVGIAILAINFGSLMTRGRYYPLTVPFSLPLLLGGLCLVTIGQPRTASGTPALWGRVLLVSSATVGAGLGVLLTILLFG